MCFICLPFIFLHHASKSTLFTISCYECKIRVNVVTFLHVLTSFDNFLATNMCEWPLYDTLLLNRCVFVDVNDPRAPPRLLCKCFTLAWIIKGKRVMNVMWKKKKRIVKKRIKQKTKIHKDKRHVYGTKKEV